MLLPSPNEQADRRVSTNLTKQMFNKFKDVFLGIVCFGGTFFFQVKEDSKPYQASVRGVAYALQKPFKEE